MLDFKEIAKDVIELEARELISAANRVQKVFADSVDIISKMRGKLIVTGVGKSGLVGAKMAATFSSTGTSSFFLHPTEAMHGDLGMMTEGDVVLAISYSGESEEITKILPHIKRFQVPLIGMTSDATSTLGKASDVVFDIRVSEEACPLNVAPTSSTTLTMAMGDALAICLMHKKSFKKEDFASFHPGGALGKKLFVKLSDIYRTDNLPVVSRGTKLKDALVILGEGRLGNVLIIDEENRLNGILSDGDLRRAIMHPDFNIEENIEKYACLDPKIVSDPNMLASQALGIIEQAKIQLLIVVDQQKKIIGVIHLHDLVEAGIR